MSQGKKLLRGRVCLMKELGFSAPHNCGASPVSPQPGYDTKHPGTDKKKMLIFQFLWARVWKINYIFFENCRPREAAPGTIRTKANFTFYFGASCNFLSDFRLTLETQVVNWYCWLQFSPELCKLFFSSTFLFLLFYRPRILILWVQFPLLWESRVAWLMV